MRYVVACAISVALGCAFAGSIGPRATSTSLTVVFHFDSAYSNPSFLEMKRELGSILKDSGIQVDWRDRNQLSSSDSFDNLVVVNFRGRCQMDPATNGETTPGPLAFTHRANGVPLPFSEVECDRVRTSVQRGMGGDDYIRSTVLFGRALARVLAHELYHVLASTGSHAARGIAQPALSSADLVSEQLQLNDAELDRMRR